MITPIYATLLGIMYLALAWYLVFLKRLSVWKKDDFILRIWDRAQHARAHVQSYGPFGLLLMLLMELGGSGRSLLHGTGALLLVGNAVHAYGFVWFPGSRAGASVGWLIISAAYVVAFLALLWHTMTSVPV
jgi:uncharacterized membrane protein YecN with MAPEG domain